MTLPPEHPAGLKEARARGDYLLTDWSVTLRDAIRAAMSQEQRT